MAALGVDGIALLGDIARYGAEPEMCCDRDEALVTDGVLRDPGTVTMRPQVRQRRWRP